MAVTAVSSKASTVQLHVPFLDLKTQYSELREEINGVLLEVAESTAFALGPKVEEFEKAFAEFVGSRHCVAVNSGTSALHLALLAADVGPGDEVLTVPMTFIATCWAISYVGARPVFVDVDSETCTMDIDQVQQRITPRTRAILPVHLYGQSADMEPLIRLAERHGLKVIEDAAQAHAATYQNLHVGRFGLCGCFSFYPGKNLGAYGEGGAVVTDDDQAADRMRALRDHAQRRKHHHEEIGYNYRMDGFQGAVLNVKLRQLNRWTDARRRVAASYLDGLADLSVRLPQEAAGRRHAWHLFVAQHPQRDQIRDELTTQGVQTGLHYPVPVHLQPAYRHLGYGLGDFPVAERIGRECFSLPMFPEMTEEQSRAVCDALNRILQS